MQSYSVCWKKVKFKGSQVIKRGLIASGEKFKESKSKQRLKNVKRGMGTAVRRSIVIKMIIDIIYFVHITEEFSTELA